MTPYFPYSNIQYNSGSRGRTSKEGNPIYQVSTTINQLVGAELAIQLESPLVFSIDNDDVAQVHPNLDTSSHAILVAFPIVSSGIQGPNNQSSTTFVDEVENIKLLAKTQGSNLKVGPHASQLIVRVFAADEAAITHLLELDLLDSQPELPSKIVDPITFYNHKVDPNNPRQTSNPKWPDTFLRAFYPQFSLGDSIHILP